MESKFTYLLVDLGALFFPLLFGFMPKYRFNNLWKSYTPAILIPLVLFVIWDIAFTKMGVWGFTDKYLLGINIFNLPIEEILFFVCIPFACIFTYHQMSTLLKVNKNFGQIMGWLILVFSISLAVWKHTNWYTFTAFLANSLVLIYILIIKKDHQFLAYFFIAFIFILIPFFITNGILTGSWIKDQVVWYNDNENLGIRMGTIPFEDTFYGMSLLLFNSYLFKVFLQRRKSSYKTA